METGEEARGDQRWGHRRAQFHTFVVLSPEAAVAWDRRAHRGGGTRDTNSVARRRPGVPYKYRSKTLYAIIIVRHLVKVRKAM